MGLLRTLIGGTIGMALGGPVGAFCGAIIANDTTSSRGYDDGSDVGDSGSGVGDTCDE